MNRLETPVRTVDEQRAADLLFVMLKHNRDTQKRRIEPHEANWILRGCKLLEAAQSLCKKELQ